MEPTKRFRKIEYWHCGKEDHWHKSKEVAEQCMIKRANMGPLTSKKEYMIRDIEVFKNILNGASLKNEGIRLDRHSQTIIQILRKITRLSTHPRFNPPDTPSAYMTYSDNGYRFYHTGIKDVRKNVEFWKGQVDKLEKHWEAK